MSERKQTSGAPATQTQGSRQSSQAGSQQKGGAPASSGDQARTGIGSSQGQDTAERDEQRGGRPSAGTPDIERGAATDERPRGSEESLVQDSTGAYKERP